MAAVLVRNIPNDTLKALKARAARSGRSTEAEIRAILAAAVTPPLRIGSALAEIGRQLGGVELDLQAVRGKVRPARLG